VVLSCWGFAKGKNGFKRTQDKRDKQEESIMQEKDKLGVTSKENKL